MRITELTAYNYKSLREVTIRPRAFNVLVGPNDSGKSNLADCLDFLADVYRSDLRGAITNKGGFESIAFWNQSRPSKSVGLSLKMEAMMPRELKRIGSNVRSRLRFHHEFHFRARNAGIREEYHVEREDITVSLEALKSTIPLLVVRRLGARVEVEHFTEWDRLASAESSIPWDELIGAINQHVPSSELLLSGIVRLGWSLGTFVKFAQSIRVYQFSPLAARQSPSRGAEPQLDRYGENLPVVIDVLQRRSPTAWMKILSVMRRLNPRLAEINVVNPDGQLRLLFREEGSDRPWGANQVSDGTIQSLALLVAIFDPQSRFLVLEEPENSVHPWILRNIVEASRAASKRKQILLTTHSPVLIDAVRPGDVWLMSRDGEGSRIEILDEVEPEIERSWRAGALAISEFLDSGALETYVPAGVRSSGSRSDGDPQEEDD
jgi:predicted ATPase